jgi:hypothetical protein
MRCFCCVLGGWCFGQASCLQTHACGDRGAPPRTWVCLSTTHTLPVQALATAAELQADGLRLILKLKSRSAAGIRTRERLLANTRDVSARVNKISNKPGLVLVIVGDHHSGLAPRLDEVR